MLTDIHDNKHIAEAFLVKSLGVCGHDKNLSSKALDIVSGTPGRLRIMFQRWFDPNLAERFDAAPRKPAGTTTKRDDNPHVEMGRFVVDFQRRVSDALTVAEDLGWTPAHHAEAGPGLSAEDRARYHLPAEDRVLCHAAHTLYTCVAGRDVFLDDAEFLVRPKGPWQTGICTVCPNVPPWGSTVDDAFVDALVANLRHVFVPVFDTSGYLIWTPLA